jgi:phospholipase/carboxylesterase
MRSDAEHRLGILSARPAGHPGRLAPSGGSERGTRRLGLGAGRDGLLHGPATLAADTPAPLLIMLHGAGASASDVMPLVSEAADKHAVLVAAPDARGPTWDVIQHGYGPDVAFLDRMLDWLFDAYTIDPARIAIAGFSDGASYALSLGLGNGALFSDILALSPGFAAPSRTEDRPRIFIAHGREDPVLPFERCGDRLAAALTQSGYDVAYRPFSGGHVVPSEIVAMAFARFLS